MRTQKTMKAAVIGAFLVGVVCGMIFTSIPSVTAGVLVSEDILGNIFKSLKKIDRQLNQSETSVLEKKLEEVLKNQETILSELQVIKVRASRKN